MPTHRTPVRQGGASRTVPRAGLVLAAVLTLVLLDPWLSPRPDAEPLPPLSVELERRAEEEMLRELARWVRGGDGLAAVTSRDVSRALREGQRGFEVFRAYHDREVRGDYLQRLPFGRDIQRTAERHGLDGLLVASLVEVESSFRPRVTSPVGAVGLMQVMPGTGALYGVDDLTDPRTNLETGTRYFRYLLELFSGDVELALAAYNAGPGNVRRYGGVPPFPETRRYVEKVFGTYLDHHRELWQESGAARRLEQSVRDA